MRNHTAGTVSVTSASRLVTGKGTMWSSSGIEEGDLFTVSGGRPHVIASVLDDTTLSLEVPYVGDTAVDQAYSVALSLDRQTVADVSEKVEDARDGSYSGSLAVIPSGMAARLATNAQSLILGSLTVNGSYQVDGELRVQAWPA